MPVLIALDAQRRAARSGERERDDAAGRLLPRLQKNRLEPGEFVQAHRRAAAAPAQVLRAYKISKRYDHDISAVCAGLAIELDGDAVATRAHRVRRHGGDAQARARSAEAALRRPAVDRGRRATAAMAALAEDFQPLTDMRASAAYRSKVAQNLLRRFWLETRAADPLPDVSADWIVMAHGRTSLPPGAVRRSPR